MHSLFMKTSVILVFVVSLLAIIPAAQAQQQDWVGSWQYTAPQADPPYQEGTIIFDDEGEELQVFIEINENRIPAQGVEVLKDSASFSISIEGQPIGVSLTKEAETLSGEATFSGQKIPITAERAM